MNIYNNLKQKNTEEIEGGRAVARPNAAESAQLDATSVFKVFRKSSLLPRSPPMKAASMPNIAASTSKVPSSDLPSETASRVHVSEPVDYATPTTASGIPALPSAGTMIGTPTLTSAPMASIEIATPAEKEPPKSSPRQELIFKMQKMEEDSIARCKKTLGKMLLAMRRQKNISKEVKDGVSELSELLDVAMEYRRTWKAKVSQKASSIPPESAPEQAAEFTPTTSKRAATSPAVPDSSKKAREKGPAENNKGPPERKEENWQTVTKKGKGKKPVPKEPKDKPSEPRSRSRPQRPKPEAVIVKPTEGHSYAEILKDLRSKMMTDDSSKVRSVRKTRTGALLLEFGRGEKVSPEFVKQLKNTVQETASIAELKPTSTIEIRDLDSLTAREEVEMAVRKLLPNPDEQLQIRITAPNAREQVRAFVTLPSESAAKLIEAGSIKIGWLRVKMRACESIRRCYRCLGTGHTQSNCSGPDRRDTCIKCGQTGHKMKDCTAVPKCVLCAHAKRERTDHLPGSRRCPLTKKK
mgnify:CR=1 FL=1